MRTTLTPIALEMVSTELSLAEDPERIDAETAVVSGSTADGTHDLESDGAELYEVTLVVTDVFGNRTAEMKPFEAPDDDDECGDDDPGGSGPPGGNPGPPV